MNPIRKPVSRSGDLDIFDNFHRPDWVPNDAKWEDLTDEEQKRVRNYYRFSGYRPSHYQAITGMHGNIY